jgi:hypothetical protein
VTPDLVEELGPLGRLLGGLLERQDRLEAEVEELREAQRPPMVMRAVEFVQWYRRSLGYPEAPDPRRGRHPISYQTLMRWWGDREINGAAVWGSQEGQGATLWVDAHALLRWVAAGHHDGRKRPRSRRPR